jgi:hypothetical protein
MTSTTWTTSTAATISSNVLMFLLSSCPHILHAPRS